MYLYTLPADLTGHLSFSKTVSTAGLIPRKCHVPGVTGLHACLYGCGENNHFLDDNAVGALCGGWCPKNIHPCNRYSFEGRDNFPSWRIPAMALLLPLPVSSPIVSSTHVLACQRSSRPARLSQGYFPWEVFFSPSSRIHFCSCRP